MAEKVVPIRPASRQTSEEEALKTEAMDRLKDCEREKALISQDIEECYFFAAPRRVRSANSMPALADTRNNDHDELMTSFAMEVTDDFAEMLISSFTPPESPWAERKTTPSDDEEADKTVNEAAKKEDIKIFAAIRGSNYYAEKGKTAVPDAAVGVVAFLIEDPGRGRPIRVLGIPIRELEIGLGPEGRIDDRWIKRGSKLRNLPSLIPGVELPEELARKKRDEPNARCVVKWGWWRKWERIDDEVWQTVIFVDEHLVHHGELMGEGSCPLVVGRFGATPDFAWPDGPLIKCLADLRNLDELTGAKIESIDFTTRPSVAYEEDGVINLSAGVEPGMAYPKRPNGGKKVFENIFESTPIDAALLDEQNLIQRIRRMHYVDFPEQKGKTPPSASQWLDEMVLKQRRIGTPGHSYWREEPFETFQRFRYLLEKRGTVKPVMMPDGTSIQPYNPAQRAHENQEVLTATRLLQIAASTFPQTLPVMVDDQKTLQNLQEKLGDKLVAFRAAEDLKQAFDNVGQLSGVIGPRTTGGLPATT